MQLLLPFSLNKGAAAQANLRRAVQTKDPGGTTALGFQHRGGPVESIMTVAENPRSASVSPEMMEQPLATNVDVWRRIASNDTPQKPRDARRTS